MILSEHNPSLSTEGNKSSSWSSKFVDDDHEKDDDSSSSASSSTFQVNRIPGIMFSLCTLFRNEDV